jgi:hypothetical protein
MENLIGRADRPENAKVFGTHTGSVNLRSLFRSKDFGPGTVVPRISMTRTTLTKDPICSMASVEILEFVGRLLATQ